jgi:hypothetical protein
MTGSALLRAGVTRRSMLFAISVLVATAAMFSSIAVGSLTSAKASTAAKFCGGWLDPAWTGNYRCDSPDSVSGYNRKWVGIVAVERSGCVNYADVWHNLITSWVCTPKYSETVIGIRNDGGWYRGAIRNNNLSYGGAFSGTIWW